MWQGGPRRWTGRPLGSAKVARYLIDPDVVYFGKYFNVFSLGVENTCICNVFATYLNVFSLGDMNTCICVCILKYYDVFRVAFENTCIDAVFLCI